MTLRARSNCSTRIRAAPDGRRDLPRTLVSEQSNHRRRSEYGGTEVRQAHRLKELEKENARLRKAVSDLTRDQLILNEALSGKVLSPSRRRRWVDRVVRELRVSECRACAVLGQHRSTQRKLRKGRADEDILTRTIIRLATRYGRCGYRRIHWLLPRDGWHVSRKRVKRKWRRDGLKVLRKQPKRGRPWLNDGPCICLRPTHGNHLRSHDLVQDRTHDGKAFRMLTIFDEYSRACLATETRRKLTSQDVLHVLGKRFLHHGPPEHIRSDNGPGFVAQAVREWLGRLNVKTPNIEPGSPWENGYRETFRDPGQAARKAPSIDTVLTVPAARAYTENNVY